MSQRFKIRETIPGVCTSCKSSQIMTTRASVRVFCNQLNQFIPEPLTHCNEFHDAAQPDKWDLSRIAWYIDTSKKQIGFIQPGTAEHKKIREGRDYDNDL